MYRPLREQAHSRLELGQPQDRHPADDPLWERACSGRRSDDGVVSIATGHAFCQRTSATPVVGRQRVHPANIASTLIHSVYLSVYCQSKR
jgi:hypothetical protein